jgi:two-component system, NtrC family, sensor kinase
MARRPRSLRLELIATLTIVLMMAVVSLSLAAEVLGGRRHEAQQRARLVEHARGLAAIVGPLLEPASLHGGPVEPVLRPSVGSMGIEAIEIHRLDRDRDRADTLVSLGLAPALPRPAPDAEGHLVESDGRWVVDHAIRTFSGASDRRRSVLVLRLVARPSPWTRLGDWTTTLMLAGGVGGVLVLLGGILLDVQVLRPLRAIRRAADEVADGNLEAEVPADGPAELAALAGAFNRMTASLRRQQGENAAQRRSLARAEQLASVGRLSAGVAHEVGNPLAAILGYVELLLDPRSQPALDPEQRALLERCRTQLERIQGIVGQLLDYSRPAHGDPQPVALHAAAERLASLLRHDPRCRDATLRLEGDARVQALADPGHLDQVLQNLVVNACRAASHTAGAGAAPLVVLRVAADGDEAVLEVQDSGPGVADELRPRLFEPFVTTARAGEGSGLGLATSRGLVEAMRGRLECLPTGARAPLRPEGSPGAVFRVILPRAEPSAAPPPPSEGRPGRSRSPENPAPPGTVQGPTFTRTLRMRHRLALVSVLSAATLLASCAPAYKSFYRETDRSLHPKPVAADKVMVVKDAGDLRTSWSELGSYEGHAPTVKEAMDAAKRTCGRYGADYFILNVQPFESRGVWKVDGICAAKAGT